MSDDEQPATGQAVARRRRRGPDDAPRLTPSPLLLLLLLLTACAVALPGQPSRPPERVAFVTADRAIATIGAAGGPTTTLSPPAAPAGATERRPRVYGWPTWSPDGQRVAFLAIDGAGGSGAVFVAEATGANRVTIHELASGYPIYLSWSPDGGTVAMLTAGEDTLHLLLGDATGRGTAHRISSGQPLFSSWAADSQALLVHAGGSGFASPLGQLHLVATTPNRQPEPIDLDPSPFRAPAWAPTGVVSVLAGDNGLGSEALYLRAPDGSLRRFAEVSGPPAIVWAPAGDRFAWSSLAVFPDSYDGLQVATPDGRTRLRLTDDRLFAFFWAPDGKSLAYLTLDSGQAALELRVIPASGGSSRVVATFQPSREYVQLLSFFDQYAQSAAIWSADSQRLTFAGWPPEVDDDQSPTIYTVPADGSAPAQALTPGRIGFYAPAPPLPRPTPSPRPR